MPQPEEDYAAKQARARDARLSLLTRYLSKLSYFVDQFPDKQHPADRRGEKTPPLAELTPAIKMVCNELRLEYRPLPAAETNADAPPTAGDGPPADPLLGLRLLKTGSD